MYIQLNVFSSLLYFITFLPVFLWIIAQLIIPFEIIFICINQLYEIVDFTMTFSHSTSPEVSNEPWMQNTLLSAKAENLLCPDNRSRHPSSSSRAAPHSPAATVWYSSQKCFQISPGTANLLDHRAKACITCHVWESKQSANNRAGSGPGVLSPALRALPQCKTLQNTKNFLFPIVFPSHKLKPRLFPAALLSTPPLSYLCSALLNDGEQCPEVSLLNLAGDPAQDLNLEEKGIQEHTMEKRRTSFL